MSQVRVTPHPVFLPLKSDAQTQRFVFAYTITIENLSEVALTLRSRYWRITDANDAVQEVRGDGVIGLTPRILPGASFTYTSGAIIETATGMMEGEFYLEDDAGVAVVASIPLFALVPPSALH